MLLFAKLCHAVKHIRSFENLCQWIKINVNHSKIRQINVTDYSKACITTTQQRICAFILIAIISCLTKVNLPLTFFRPDQASRK